MSSEDVRKTLSQKGLERSKLFDWDKCVDQTLNVFEKVVNN
jgi:glycosyltransferase involved in cell wall biosynthesis